jgi:hypothetical protein
VNSKPTSFEEALDAVLSHMRQVMIAKQQDYGPGNIAKFGEMGVLVRASDKLERLVNLLQSGHEPKHEAIDDSWLDLANYGLIAQMIRQGIWGLPLSDQQKG